MKNQVYEKGHKLQYTNASGSTIAAGTLVIVGQMIGIASADIADQATGTLELAGVYSLKKKATVAVSQGDALYWETAGSQVTKTNTDKKLGHAFADAAGSDAEVQVRLIPNLTI